VANIAEAWRKRRYEAHFISKLTDADAELIPFKGGGEINGVGAETWFVLVSRPDLNGAQGRHCSYPHEGLAAHFTLAISQFLGGQFWGCFWDCLMTQSR